MDHLKPFLFQKLKARAGLGIWPKDISEIIALLVTTTRSRPLKLVKTSSQVTRNGQVWKHSRHTAIKANKVTDLSARLDVILKLFLLLANSFTIDNNWQNSKSCKKKLQLPTSAP